MTIQAPQIGCDQLKEEIRETLAEVCLILSSHLISALYFINEREHL